MKLLISLVALVFTLHAAAQTQDYLLTVNNDTLKHPVTRNLLGANYRYQTPDNKKHRIKTEYIKEFYVSTDTALFRAIPVSYLSRPVFARVLENGKIKLYDYSIQNKYGVTVYWYISSDSVPLTLIKTNGFEASSRESRKELLNKMLAGDEEALQYINGKGLTWSDVENAVKIYNKKHG